MTEDCIANDSILAGCFLGEAVERGLPCIQHLLSLGVSEKRAPQSLLYLLPVPFQKKVGDSCSRR